MRSELSNLKSDEVKLLFEIFKKLSRNQDQDTLREEISADFLASLIWNQDRHVFEHVVFLNMSPDNLARYDKYHSYKPVRPGAAK